MISGTIEHIVSTEPPGELTGARPALTPLAVETFNRLLVATDGSSASDGALRLADLIAQRDGSAVAVLSVLDPQAPVPGGGGVAEQVEHRFASVRRQISGMVGMRPEWHAAIGIGPVGETICRVAGARAIDLIVAGFGQHRRARDRTPDKATVRALVEASSTPVLVVPAHARTLPTRVMLALDFSRSSIRAGRAALRLMGATHGVVHLVYVHANDAPFPAEPLDPDPTYTAGLASFFEAVERELAAPPGISFTRAGIQRGDPVSELLAYGVANGMELIAVGNHGKAMRERLHLGSVSAGILRSAQCPVLVSGTGLGSAPPSTQDMEVILRGQR